MTLLEDLVSPSVDLEPLLVEYRVDLREAVAAGRSADDPAVAETLAALARSLGLTAAQIRVDHKQFTKLLTLEQRFDAGELERLEQELKPLRLAETRFTKVGGQMDEELQLLRQERDAAVPDDRTLILGRMQAVEERGLSLGRARRAVEDLVIRSLNARDRLSAFRRGNRRLFPEADD